jgi:hypothetical protein
MKARDTQHKKYCGECGQELENWGQFHPIECCQSFNAGIKKVVECIEQQSNRNYILDTGLESSGRIGTCEISYETQVRKW